MDRVQARLAHVLMKYIGSAIGYEKAVQGTIRAITQFGYAVAALFIAALRPMAICDANGRDFACEDYRRLVSAEWQV